MESFRTALNHSAVPSIHKTTCTNLLLYDQNPQCFAAKTIQYNDIQYV